MKSSLIGFLIILIIIGAIFVFGAGHPFVTVIHNSLESAIKA
jgi:hypothetical protein